MTNKILLLCISLFILLYCKETNTSRGETQIKMGNSKNVSNDTGVIGKMFENGKPVIFRFENRLPPKDIRSKYPWLTIISWQYEGSENNGMPNSADNEHMIQLEDLIYGTFDNQNILFEGYARTGNNLKEFVFYINDRDIFLKLFNEKFSKYPKFPIDIKFYEDKDWEDYQNLIDSFSKK